MDQQSEQPPFKKYWGIVREKLRNLRIPLFSWKAVLLHLGLIIIIASLIIYYVFYSYLPNKTKHGEVILVPDLENMTLSQADERIHKLHLRDTVIDTVWSARHLPKAVVSQNPKKGSKVKSNRRIYLTINLSKPPVVEITEEILKGIVHVPNSEAIHTLHELGLKVKPKYVSRPHKGYVYNATVEGETLEAGTTLDLNTVVHIHIGKGNDSSAQYFDNEKYD